MYGTEGISTPWGASVYGTASVDVAPDLARLRLAIKETRPTPAEAFEVTRAAVNRVRDVLRGRGVPDGAVSTSQLGLASSWGFLNQEHQLRGYQCAASFVIELRTLEMLETVLVDAVAAGANHVNAVEFDVSTRKELRARARAAAVAAAREKAQLYARAADVRLGPVIHIADVDAEDMSGQHGFPPPGSPAESAGDRDLTPGMITISAGVLIGFALTN